MKKVELNQLLDAGVHFGHLTSKRHPNMTPYIFMEKNGMHVIDLNKTISSYNIRNYFLLKRIFRQS